MPYGDVTYGGGASGQDPIVPAISKNSTWSAVCDLVRRLSHTYGNTTVITNAEILAIVIDTANEVVKTNWKQIAPFYLQTNTFNVIGSSNPYKAYYSTLVPYFENIVTVSFLYGRKPVKMLTPDDLQMASKMTNTYSSSVLGALYDGYISLVVGSDITSPNDYPVEVYYYRQPKTAGITTSNYSTEYVDLPDSFIPELVDKAVMRVEMTKQ